MTTDDEICPGRHRETPAKVLEYSSRIVLDTQLYLLPIELEDQIQQIQKHNTRIYFTAYDKAYDAAETDHYDNSSIVDSS